MAILALDSWLVPVKVCKEWMWIPDTGWAQNMLYNRNGRKAPLTEENSVLSACLSLLIRLESDKILTARLA